MIDLDDVFCLYRGAERDVAALRGLTLRVEPGERVLVTGPSGAGKTTLVRIATGHERPSAGRAHVLGADVGGLDRRGLAALRRDGIAIVDQRSGRALRPELTAVDNVALRLGLLGLRRRERRAQAEALLDRLGLAALAGRRPGELSGGQAQRVAVCAAVVHAPGVIVADEPTGELDPATADEVYRLLADVAAEAGACLLVVSHDRRAAGHADRLLRIRDGRLSEEREPAEGGAERQVVDARGWLRLPAGLREGAGIGGRVAARAADGGVLLEGAGAAPAAPAEAALPPAAPGDVVVRARGVVRRYRADEPPALGPADLELRRGELLAVRGRSGSGKSTLLRLVAGLDRPDAGSVEVAGQDLAGLDRDGLARLRRDAVAVATQASALVDALPLADGIRAGLALRAAPRDPAPVLAALGLEALAGRPADRLSGGERQRGAIARAVLAPTPIVVLDEPTSQLDEASAGLVARVLLGEARAGRAVLCATHDPVLLAAADRILDLEPAAAAAPRAPAPGALTDRLLDR